MLLFAGGVGVLIGAVGVGGVLLAPAMVVVLGMDPHAATATSTWAFLFTGVVGTVVYARRGTVPWSTVLGLSIGCIPGAFVGARANALLPGDAVVAILAGLAVLVGVQQLWPRHYRTVRSPPSGWRLVSLGTAVGFGSALTGTGGPVLLVPSLLGLGVAPLSAVAISQAIQIPVVAAASVGYLNAGLTNVKLGNMLGVAAAFGVVVGAAVAQRLHQERLRQLVALACVLAGFLLLGRFASAVGTASTPGVPPGRWPTSATSTPSETGIDSTMVREDSVIGSVAPQESQGYNPRFSREAPIAIPNGRSSEREMVMPRSRR